MHPEASTLQTHAPPSTSEGQTGVLSERAAGTRRLTLEQLEIVTNEADHLMVEAGAGSGKTTVLTEKFLFELGHGVRPRQSAPLEIPQIAAITFTRKAAGEIQERIRQAFLRRALAESGQERERWGERAFLVNESMIGTIDSFAARILRDYGALAGMETAFETLDPADAAKLYAEVAESSILQGIEEQDAGAVFLVQQFGFLRARSILVSLLDRADLLEDLCRRLRAGDLSWSRFRFQPTAVDLLLEPRSRDALLFAERALLRLRAVMDAEGVLDHGHVILRAAALAAHPEVRKAFQERIRLLFVDEHQDTNLAQTRLILRLAGLPEPDQKEGMRPESPGVPTCRLVLIGDPKQGIYGFRHADITMWKKSRRSIEAVGGRYLRLQTNHRSRPALLRFFDCCLGRILSDHRTDLYEVPYVPLLPARPEGEAEGVEVLLADEKGPRAVAEMVAERIRLMLLDPERYPVWERQPDGSERSRPLRPRDIAILSRNLKGSAEHYERALAARGLGCYLYGGRGLYGRPEVQDVATLLKAVADPHDPFALAAFLRSPLGGVDDETLMELAAHSTAAPRGSARGSLYDMLGEAELHVSSPDRLQSARSARALLERLRSLRDRIPHDRLLEIALEESGYRAFLAGAPDAPAPLRNLDKLLRIARQAAREPLFEFVRKLSLRVRRADPEEEAPLYTPDDELITISTVHKAKGLEWPYVFVTGLDESMFHGVNTREPLLHPHLGLALPLDVMMREGRQAVPVSETSAAWQNSWEDATLKEYAESKRLFYVACTRARDRLFLCGALGSQRSERQLNPEKIRWMHMDGVERWLRHLYPELTRKGVAGEALRFGPRPSRKEEPADRAPIRRGLASLSVLSGRVDFEIAPVALPRGPRPRALPVLSVSSHLPEEVRQRLAPVVDRARIKDEFTASELLKYASCPWKHAYSYRGSVSTPHLEAVRDDALVNRVLPDVRGDILHDYFRDHKPGWGVEERRLCMKHALLRHLPMSEEAVAENVEELLSHADNYLKSDLYAQETASPILRREMPYVLRLPSGVRVHGSQDRLFAEEGGWHILDFKSGLFRGVRDVRQEVARRAAEYEIQAAIYALGVRSALPEMPVKRFSFFFTAPALAYTLETTPAWLDAWERKIEDIVRRIQREEYGAEPVYRSNPCDACPLLRLCRPEGVPAELLTSPQAEERPRGLQLL